MGVMLRIADRIAARTIQSRMESVAATPGVREFLAGADWAALDSGHPRDHAHSAYKGELPWEVQERTRAYLVRGPGESTFRKVDQDGFQTFLDQARTSGQPVRSVAYRGQHEDAGFGTPRGDLLRFGESVCGQTTLVKSVYSSGKGAFSETFSPGESLRSGWGSLGPQGLEMLLELSRADFTPPEPAVTEPEPTATAMGR